jgi:sec-independent protein translocase protein TatC
MRRLPRRLGYGEEATLVEHLEELRQRIFVCLGALLVATIVAFALHHHLLHALNHFLPHRIGKPVTLGVGEPFLTSMWISLYAGFLAALPIFVWQAWAFFAPAIDDRYVRTATVFVSFATVLLVAGVIFGYYVTAPAAVKFLTNYDHNYYDQLVQARSYYTFVVLVLFAMGIVFELPIFVLGLVRLGIVSSAKLRRTRRVGYFIVACVGVALPGVDPVTTIFETIPLWLLYELSIWLSILVERRHPATQETAPQALL